MLTHSVDHEGLLPNKMEELIQQASSEVHNTEVCNVYESLRYVLFFFFPID